MSETPTTRYAVRIETSDVTGVPFGYWVDPPEQGDKCHEPYQADYDHQPLSGSEWTEVCQPAYVKQINVPGTSQEILHKGVLYRVLFP